MKSLRITVSAFLLFLAIGVFAQSDPQKSSSPAQSDAQKSFDRLKTLAGSWEGSIMGMSTQITIRVTSSGNAILHEATGPGRPDNPITMFYVDGDRLLLTHYCDAGNRPRMVGKISPDGKTVVAPAYRHILRRIPHLAVEIDYAKCIWQWIPRPCSISTEESCLRSCKRTRASA